MDPLTRCRLLAVATPTRETQNPTAPTAGLQRRLPPPFPPPTPKTLDRVPSAAMITGGQSYVSAPPAFSADGRLLLLCSGRVVSVFSASTAMLVSELEGHERDVTAVVVVAPPPAATAAAKLVSYCWTAGLDGVLIYWDFMAAEAVRKVHVGLPVHSMVIPNIYRTSKGAQVSTPFAFISVEDTSRPANDAKALRGEMKIYDLTKGRQVGGLLAQTRKPENIIASSSGELLGIANKRKLHIWKIPMKDFKAENIRKIKLHHTKRLTTLAFHPSERTVACGDVSGRILIWRGFGKVKFSGESGAKSKADDGRDGVRGEDDADICTTLHWHSSRVTFLRFSSDGAYLFSGGLEGVIVVWQLDTGKRRYKPRLGSPLLYFAESPDSSISCVSCANNQVYLLKMPNMELMKSISGIKLPILSPNLDIGHRVMYGFDYTNRRLAIPTEDYCIQLYDLVENTEVSEVQVYERNFHPVDDITIYISLVSLSLDGNLMCTVDVKLPEEELGGLVTLKFWNHGSNDGHYFLSTVIYEPHSDSGVSAVAFRPGRNMAVSSSFGGNFKIWVQSESSSKINNERNNSGWRCQSVGSYKKKPMTAAAFSGDGSVLAVAAESVITLWDPDNNALVGIIAEALSPITKLSFIGTSAFLMSISQSSRPQVAVWNVSNLSIQWSYSLFAEAACCSPDGRAFAVLALLNCPDGAPAEQNGVLLLFNAEDPNPIASWSVKKARGSSIAFIKGGITVDANDNDSMDGETLSLVCVNSSHEYVLFDPHKSGELVSSKHKGRRIQAEEPAPIGYASIYGELPKLESMKGVSDIPFIPSDRPWETIFSGSSHALPPLTKLCSTFLSSLLEKRTVANE